MKLISVKSDKNIKELLLKQLKYVQKGDRRLIQLSQERFKELENRVDVRKIRLDWCDCIFENDDIKIKDYEDDKVFSSSDYGILVFSQTMGVYILKEAIYYGYSSIGAEATKIVFIE